MTQVSKKYIEKLLREKAWKRFSDTISKTQFFDDMIKKLRFLLTPTEIIMLEKRLLIPLLLKEGKSYREIGKIIDVTPQTISFIKKGLTRKPVQHPKHSSNLTTTQRKHKKSEYIAGVFPRKYKGSQSIF